MPPRSRQTRNQDAASRSRQGQVIDLDPTDGLPVQKYSLQTIQINQDASSDPATSNTKSTNSVEWSAQFGTPQFPWPENQLPSYFKELSGCNQELIRRARAGNTNAKLSVWDRKNSRWMSAAEAEKKATPLKSLHLNNLEVSSAENNNKLANGDAESTKSGEDSDQDSSNESNKSADEDEDEEEGAPFKSITTSSKRRKLSSRLNGADETRLIEVKRWVQLPPNIAEKTPEATFLAPRRSGMPPLYNPEYVQKIFGQYHSSSVMSGATGYDLGEGGGLSNASGVLGAGADHAAGTATPPRKNIPPRRKKKKLGGPGRKKANPNPEPQLQQGVSDGTTASNVAAAGQSGAMEGVEQTVGSEIAGTASQAEQQNEGEGDDNESGSEAEGSEEGEIDESGGAGHATTHDIPPADEEPQLITSAPNPQVTVTDADITMKEPDHEPAAQVQPQVESLEEEKVVSEQTPQADPPQPLSEINQASTDLAATTSTEISIPGIGDITNDPEQAQIVEENAQALSSDLTDTKQDVDLEVDVEAAVPDSEPQPELRPSISEISVIDIPEPSAEATTSADADIDAAPVPAPVPEIITTTELPVEVDEQRLAEEVPGDTVETATVMMTETEMAAAEAKLEKAEAEGEAEMDLLGAMDAAIDRGMSEGA